MNAAGRNGLTPLHLATHYGSLPIVELLLENKVSRVLHMIGNNLIGQM
ncbi:unnamed protein product [Trichobilharzia regenti]|nr:unnamed protein product [Trichobilharzia regenti]